MRPSVQSSLLTASENGNGSCGQLIQFPKVRDVRGNLTFVEGLRHIPFPIRRVYYLYDVPSGETRGGHAHKNHRECLIAASGSFTVSLDDGFHREQLLLNRPDVGLYSPVMIWRELANFSSGAICLVLASEEYDESDYYRDYDDFLTAAHARLHPLS